MAPGGHAGEADTTADDVVELAIGEILRLRGTQIGNFGIEIATDLGLAATVAAVTKWHSEREVFVRLLQRVGRGLPRVGCASGSAGNSEIANCASDEFFDGGRLLGGAEAAAD